MYRIPTMIEELSHNHLIMKERGLLEYKKKRGHLTIPPLRGLNGAAIEPLVPLLTFIENIELDKSIENEETSRPLGKAKISRKGPKLR